METVVSKVDLSKVDRSYYHAGPKAEIRDLDAYFYLTVSGQCAPEDQKFLTAIETIYSVAYAIKFLCKGEDHDFVVPKMECHWFIEGGLEKQHLFTKTPRNEWCWKILFRMPDFVEENHFLRALSAAKGKDPERTESYDQLIFELINEGRCAQVMHVGSWDDEGPSLEKIFTLIEEEGLSVSGYHKEIYISDPNRTEETRKKTILRYQVS